MYVLYVLYMAHKLLPPDFIIYKSSIILRKYEGDVQECSSTLSQPINLQTNEIKIGFQLLKVVQ
jgi:hypothetical protein